jgi:hypothetical protein
VRCTRPLRSTCSICDGAMSQYAIRRRVDSSISAAPRFASSVPALTSSASRFASSSSSCAATSIGEYSVSSGSPAVTRCPVAFTATCSTYPSTFAAIDDTRVSSNVTWPTVRTSRVSGPRSATAYVMPMRRASSGVTRTGVAAPPAGAMPCML